MDRRGPAPAPRRGEYSRRPEHSAPTPARPEHSRGQAPTRPAPAQPQGEPLGVPLHRAKSGHLILRLTGPQAPPVGARVTTRNNRPVGHITDIFGPTSRPYISIRPEGPLENPREPLYLSR